MPSYSVSHLLLGEKECGCIVDLLFLLNFGSNYEWVYSEIVQILMKNRFLGILALKSHSYRGNRLVIPVPSLRITNNKSTECGQLRSGTYPKTGRAYVKVVPHYPRTLLFTKQHSRVAPSNNLTQFSQLWMNHRSSRSPLWVHLRVTQNALHLPN